MTLYIEAMIFCYSFYDEKAMEFLEEYIETNLQKKDRTKFICECIHNLKTYTYSEDDGSIIDKDNLLNYLLKKYTEDNLFYDLTSKKVTKIIQELRDIEIIEEIFYYPISLKELISFYYIGFLYHNKYNIIKYLLKWLE
jgi:hypothetical protein